VEIAGFPDVQRRRASIRSLGAVGQSAQSGLNAGDVAGTGRTTRFGSSQLRDVVRRLLKSCRRKMLVMSILPFGFGRLTRRLPSS
jgi:hypothetical protein